MSCGLTLAAIEPVDARSLSDEADAEPTQSGAPIIYVDRHGASLANDAVLASVGSTGPQPLGAHKGLQMERVMAHGPNGI